MKSTWGEQLKLEIFGESHGPEIGMVLQGIPAGLPVDMDRLQMFLDRRAPGNSANATSRKEADKPVFLSGIENGATTGKAIYAIIKNTNARRSDYHELADTPRPGHADYTARMKYGSDIDLSGGGHFSGRLTAPLCIAGGLCMQWLESSGIGIHAHILSIGNISDDAYDPVTPKIKDICKSFPVINPDKGAEMEALIAKVRDEKDSVGGWIEIAVTGLPVGLGGPMFSGMESRISQIIYGIPAVKGIIFGDTAMLGSENNDPFTVTSQGVMTTSNHCGGILGGITNGMPLIFRAQVKPTPSIGKPQKTISISRMANTTIEITGRHDPCILPRAVPVMEAATALAIFDAMLQQESSLDLQALRRQIDIIDQALIELFCKRMDVSANIAKFKKENQLPIYIPEREAQKLEAISLLVDEGMGEYVRSFFQELFTLSKDYQSKLI